MKGENDMKVKIIVQETTSKELEVEVSSIENAYNEIQDMYKNEEIVIEDANLIDAQLAILDEDGQVTGWDSII